jgi:hypothetical protein
MGAVPERKGKGRKMIEVLQNLLWIFIFPGFLFTACCGLLAYWVVRKVSALVQYRVGPPWYQPFADVVKDSLYSRSSGCTGGYAAALDNALADNRPAGYSFCG